MESHVIAYRMYVAVQLLPASSGLPVGGLQKDP